jgi:hypothetical protein
MMPSCFPPSSTKPLHVAIIGDELEACITAMMLLRLGTRVTLFSRRPEALGGLSTRGGLAYMDITPEYLPPLMAWLLPQCGWERVALHPETTMAVLGEQLTHPNLSIRPFNSCPILSWTNGQPGLSSRVVSLQDAANGESMNVDAVIDATPDASLAHITGHTQHLGLGGIFRPNPSPNSRSVSLGVSPLFRISGLDVSTLQAAEAGFRTTDKCAALLARHMAWLREPERHELLHRPTYAGVDYLDILNPCIGVAFHEWAFANRFPYENAPYWVDGFNIACLKNGTLSFNGLVMRLPLQEQLDLSEQGLPPPPVMQAAMQDFLEFIKAFTGTEDLALIPPDEVYIRQTRITQMREQLRGLQILNGGVSAEESVGSFSYWLDYRGIHPWRYYKKIAPLPKPTFNASLKPHCSPLAENLFVLGRSAGYSPLSQGACRIVQYNAMIGEALAIALTIAHREHRPVWQVPAREIRHIHAQQAQALGVPLHPHNAGQSVVTSAIMEHPIFQRDEAFQF